MPIASSRLAAISLLALAAGSLTAPACTLLVGGCDCPDATGLTMVTVLAAQSSPIASVSAGSPCTAWDGGADNVSVSTPSATTCQVAVDLANGDRYTFSVEFRYLTSDGGGCDCTLLRAIGTTGPTLVGGGVDGSATD